MTDYPTCLCGSTDYRRYDYLWEGKPFFVLLCRRCRLGRTWPAPLTGQKLTDFYEERTDYEERFEQLELWQRFCKRILTIIKTNRPSGRLLDVGCNLGIFVKEAARAGFQAEGVDMSAEAITYGANRLGLAGCLHHGTLAEQKYADGQFDVMTYLHCFEHLEDPVTELAEAKRVLAADGIVVIEVPRFTSLWRIVLGNRWYGFSALQHIWQFSARGLAGILERSGFTIVTAYTRRHLYHQISFSPAGLAKAAIAALAWLTGTGDNLIVVARKRS